MNRNGLVISKEKWSGKACVKCGSEMFKSKHYLYCSSSSCSYSRKIDDKQNKIDELV